VDLLSLSLVGAEAVAAAAALPAAVVERVRSCCTRRTRSREPLEEAEEGHPETN
jgi:hypothetical protein